MSSTTSQQLQEPTTDFAGSSTPYIDYLATDVLLSLQRPRSDVPAEMTFIVIAQVQELLFKLLYDELVRARSQLDADDASTAVQTLRRAHRVGELLVATWEVLGTLTPTEFNAFRPKLGEASGYQSYMYRMLEFALGNKAQSQARVHHNVPDVSDQIDAALHAPSVYDAAIAYLARHGAAIPRPVLERDVSNLYEPCAEVEQAWADRYHAGDTELAEALMDVAEVACRWRLLHLLTAERVIGTKPGTGGSAGAPWLRQQADHRFFPELWTVREQL